MNHRSFRSTLQALTIGCLQLLAARGVASFAPPGGERHISTRPQPSGTNPGTIPRPDEDASFVGNSPRRPPSLARTSGRPRPPPARASRSSVASTDDNGAGGKAGGEATKELTPASIAEMIEVSFVQSCLQLSQGYVDVLKLFIVSVKTGYELPLPLEELHALVQECPKNSAGRELMREETELRREWMAVVYELLNALKSESGAGAAGKGDDDAAKSRVSGVVRAMLSIRDEVQDEETTSGGKADATAALSALTVEQALERSPALSELREALASDPLGKAILTNDVRVALTTFQVLEEERACTEGASGLKGEVPRPPIPGT